MQDIVTVRHIFNQLKLYMLVSKVHLGHILFLTFNLQNQLHFIDDE